MYLKINHYTGSFFITSDLHLYHRNIIKYANRPFKDSDEMNHHLITNWNSVVSPDDYVFNLGDFSFANDDKTVAVLSQLNGTQFFVYGNHDKIMRSDKVVRYCRQTGKIKTFSDVITTNYKGQALFMSHYSHRVWDRAHHGAIHFYGHSHGGLPGIGRSMDVGVDSSDMPSNFTPFRLSEVIEHMLTREPTAHHS